jgi:hypothetical protein
VAGWILSADAGYRFPTADAIRARLDHLGVSVFRSIYSEQQVTSKVETLLPPLYEELASRRNDDGWVFATGSGKTEHDYWVHPQVIAVESRRGGLSRSSLHRLVTRAGLMFEPTHIVRDSENREIGWEGSRTTGYVRAEPMLWTGAALAILYQQLDDDDADRVRIRDWMARYRHITDSLLHLGRRLESLRQPGGSRSAQHLCHRARPVDAAGMPTGADRLRNSR